MHPRLASPFSPLSGLCGGVRRAAYAALVGSALLAGGAAAQASVPGAPGGPGTPGEALDVARGETSFAHQCRAADLIFEGVVESVRTRNSDVRHAGDVSLPHTFVTFRVERVFKGGITGTLDGTLTLRFIGGPDSNGGTLFVSHAPTFEVGSHEILLVRNSETWAVPLVNGKQRRFQIQGDRVLSESGKALEVAGGTVRVRPSDKANETTPELERARSLPGDVFRATLDNLIRQTHDAQAFIDLRPVDSLVFEQPFYVPAPTERAPQVMASDLAEPVLDPESRR